MSSRRRRPSRTRKALWQVLLVVAAFALAEAGLRWGGLGPPEADIDPYVGFAHLPLFVPDPEHPGGLVTAPNKRNNFNVQRFLAQKPPGTYRIVALGGSTTYGHPYTDPVSFPGWLRELLPAADPSRPWEVINAGGISYASYRVASVLDELCAYSPDLFVIYTGHNEFLEERTYAAVRDAPAFILRLGVLLRRSAIFHALLSLRGAPDEPEDPAADGPDRLTPEVATLLDRSVGPDAYERDDVLQQQVVEHFRFNLERMIARARRAGADVVLALPAGQLRECRPFKSALDDGLSQEAADEVRRVLADPRADVDALRRASALSPRHAELAHRLGETLLAQGDVPGGRLALERARDEDIVPLRAIGPVLRAMEQIAAARDVPCLDTLALVDDLAARHTGIPVPGRSVFLDHVHLTVEGYREVALALVDLLAARGIVSPGAQWRTALGDLTARVEARLSTEDHARALARLAAVLDWARKREEAEAFTDAALRLSDGGDAMSWWSKGNFHMAREEWDDARHAYEQALQIDARYTEAHHNLAAVLLRLERPDEALVAVTTAESLGGIDARTAYTRAGILDALGRRDEVRAALLEALEHDPSHAGAHTMLGVEARRDGRNADAESHWEAAMAADPGAERPRYNLAVLREEQGRAADAEALLREVLRLDPEHVPARARLGQILARAGRLDEALAELEVAAALRPEDASLSGAVAKLRAAGARRP